MFYLYGTTGHLFTGPLEHLRGRPGVRPVSRAAAVGAVHAGEHPVAPVQAASRDAPHREAVAAYAAAADESGGARHRLHRAEQLMSRPAHLLSPQDRLRTARALFAAKGIGQAPVVDTQGRLIGLLARAALLPAEADIETGDAGADHRPPLGPDGLVGDAMWSPVPACAPQTDIRRVVELLLATGLPGLPVIDEQGAVLGFLSRTDLLRAMVADPPLDLWG